MPAVMDQPPPMGRGESSSSSRRVMGPSGGRYDSHVMPSVGVPSGSGTAYSEGAGAAGGRKYTEEAFTARREGSALASGHRYAMHTKMAT